MRLRFRRLNDRWTHAIEIGPGPWQTLAEAIEWTTAAEDSNRIVSPVYQEVHFQHDGDSVLALLVGLAGPHHFSAAVKVSHRVSGPPESHDFGEELSESTADFDVANRCRATIQAFDCHYKVHAPPAILPRGDSEDRREPDGFRKDDRPCLTWETKNTEDHVDVSVRGSGDPASASSVALKGWNPSGGGQVRIAPQAILSTPTHRVRYFWTHTRVRKRLSVP